MSVYFVRAGKRGPIKIGYANDVRSRLQKGQTLNHEPLVLLGIVPGGKELETALHAKFSEYRLRGEWFALKGSLAEYVSILPPPPVDERKSREESNIRASYLGQIWFDLSIPSDAEAARRLRMDARLLRRGIGPSGRTRRKAI
jgi:hypothetical protein